VQVTPNPSINRTFPGKPGHAAYLKRRTAALGRFIRLNQLPLRVESRYWLTDIDRLLFAAHRNFTAVGPLCAV